MNDDDELLGFVLEHADVLVDDLTGDVGVRAGDWLLIMAPDVAATLARDLLEATRIESRAVTPAKARWTAE